MEEGLSLFFYTNNLLCKPLLESTLKEAIKSCKENYELIITSHYPVLEKFTEIPMEEGEYKDDINYKTGERYKSKIYDHIVEDLQIKTDNPNIKNYVVGRLPYSVESLFTQIVLSCEKAKYNHVILLEHDCFYPENYISVVKKYLIEHNYDFTYCSFARCFLDSSGFFTIDDNVALGYLLSSCSGKKELLKNLFQRKLDLLKEKKVILCEPLLDIHSSLKAKGLEEYKREIIIKKHLCIDVFIKNAILDIRHELNASDGPSAYDHKYFQDHEYWGNSKKYIDMIKELKVDEEDLKKWCYGTFRLGY